VADDRDGEAANSEGLPTDSPRLSGSADPIETLTNLGCNCYGEGTQRRRHCWSFRNKPLEREECVAGELARRPCGQGDRALYPVCQIVPFSKLVADGSQGAAKSDVTTWISKHSYAASHRHGMYNQIVAAGRWFHGI
jgi:hypothetical protein